MRWLLLAVVAFALSVWMTLALPGVAHADDQPPPNDQTTSAAAPEHRETDLSASAAPKRFFGVHLRPTRYHSELRDRITAHIKAIAPKPSSSTSKQETRPDDARHGNRVIELRNLTAVAVKPAKPTTRNAGVSSAQTTPDVKAPAANPAPSEPAQPSAAAPTGAPDPQQLRRAATGFLSDAGVVAASAVYTVADGVARAFGPNDFHGVPHALATVLANTAAAAGRAFLGAPLGAAEPGRFTVTYGVYNALTLLDPQQPPPGANDDSIEVTDEHPLPIILLNGTGLTQGLNWSVGAAVLANAGYKVYTFNYGNVTDNPNSPMQATGDIAKSAEELDDEIDRVLAETGAEKVILIGHSQGGGILPAYYINNVEGGADKVSQVIGIAPSNHGTDFNGLVGLLRVPVVGPLVVAVANLVMPAGMQQTVGSDFQDIVYGTQDANPNVRYTNIITRNDEVVTPYTQQLLEGDSVTNIILQERFPGYVAGHAGVVLDPRVWSVVLEALEANPEANPQLHPQELVA